MSQEKIIKQMIIVVNTGLSGQDDMRKISDMNWSFGVKSPVTEIK